MTLRTINYLEHFIYSHCLHWPIFRIFRSITMFVHVLKYQNNTSQMNLEGLPSTLGERDETPQGPQIFVVRPEENLVVISHLRVHLAPYDSSGTYEGSRQIYMSANRVSYVRDNALDIRNTYTCIYSLFITVLDISIGGNVTQVFTDEAVSEIILASDFKIIQFPRVFDPKDRAILRDYLKVIATAIEVSFALLTQFPLHTRGSAELQARSEDVRAPPLRSCFEKRL